MEWTTASVVVTVIGSGGGVYALIAVFNLISARLDARKARLKAARDKEISDAVEIKRLELEADGKAKASIEAAMWRLIEEKQEEITAVKIELQECRSSRKIPPKVYSNIRSLQRAIEGLDNGHYTRAKALLDEINELLP